MKEDFIGAAALTATGMMIPWMGVCVNRFFEIFLLIYMERFLRWTRPGAVRVLRFDSACGAEGCGIANGHALRA